ncbi:MAG TPA: hypothetical protein VEI97_05520 [bacterium]|nr:hypothetical protein [bacterium]
MNPDPLESASRLARDLCPGCVAESVTIRDGAAGRRFIEIALLPGRERTPEPAAGAAPGPQQQPMVWSLVPDGWEPSERQLEIFRALQGGRRMKKVELVRELGCNGKMLYRGRSLKELREMGLADSYDDGYGLTDAGERVARLFLEIEE